VRLVQRRRVVGLPEFRKKLAEKAWSTFTAHQRECASCYDLRDFKLLPPVATSGESLPDELCGPGRRMLDVWLGACVDGK